MLIVISGGSTTAEYLINMMLEQNHRICLLYTSPSQRDA